MSKLDSIAQDIAESVANASGDTQAAFDPTFILVIAELLVPLIEALQECFADVNVGVEAIRNPRGVHRLAVRMKVIGQMGRREFRRNRGREIVQAIVDKGTTLTKEDLQELYDEV